MLTCCFSVFFLLRAQIPRLFSAASRVPAYPLRLCPVRLPSGVLLTLPILLTLSRSPFLREPENCIGCFFTCLKIPIASEITSGAGRGGGGNNRPEMRNVQEANHVAFNIKHLDNPRKKGCSGTWMSPVIVDISNFLPHHNA